MHRSSESVAALAAALAKAQIELVNPEKSLTATLRGERRREGNHSFHYAPLASGLDIVRKTLGKYELAIMQTTAVDQPTGLLKLTTLLAHSSGEWLSSEYPVCPLNAIDVPHRAGAALTYARRYSLFTLVGIAGEDDLDAPDFAIKTEPSPRSHESNGQGPVAPGYPNSTRPKVRPPAFDEERSKAASEQLIKEIGELTSPEQLTNWVKAALPTKNQLMATDAERVERAFAARVAILNLESASVSSSVPGPDQAKPNPLTAPFPRRRDKAHLKFVSTRPCLVCGRQPSDPHHLRFAQVPALGRKVSDEFTVPLCRSHHRDLHQSSNERNWWSGVGIEPMQIATQLWNETHNANGASEVSSLRPQPAADSARGPNGRKQIVRNARANAAVHRELP